MTVASLLGLLVYLIVLGLVFYIVVWALGWIGLPEPINKVAKAIVALVLVLVLLGVLFGGIPTPVLLR